jgi:hypothetical protein
MVPASINMGGCKKAISGLIAVGRFAVKMPILRPKGTS